MKKLLILFVLIFLAGQIYAQENLDTGVFGTNSAPKDTATLTNADTLTGRLINFKRPQQFKGAATLYLAGDTLSGTPADVNVEYRLFGGYSMGNDTLVTVWKSVGSLSSTYLTAEGYGTGKVLSGDVYNISNKTTWSYVFGIQFRYFASGTQATKLISRFLMR